MRYLILVLFCCSVLEVYSQTDTSTTYIKPVLENTEVDILSSYYQQEGDQASVTGGIGDEHITNVTPTIVISMPINANDVLTVDMGISAYTSASSSNLDPFDQTGASQGYGGDDDDDDDDDEGSEGNGGGIIGSPWVASSGASGADVWGSIAASYSHSSKDRNRISSVNASFATEYDYVSIGFGAAYNMLFNQKNTELGITANVYLDSWLPSYPTELDSYREANGNLNSGFFNGVEILNEQGNAINKRGQNAWAPFKGEQLIDNKKRNTYSMGLSFSQILSPVMQVSLFADVIQQNGWLANPTQRVYFADKPNYFIGNKESIANYTSRANTDVFMLADDIERLPESRIKIPVGFRLNYYINEFLTTRLYYRYYMDDWGLQSNTVKLEVPVKLGTKFTMYPSYRYYTQTAVDYYAPFDQHQCSSQYYTSDADLSEFTASQYGMGFSYTDVFNQFHILKFGLKSIDLKYNYYQRENSAFKAHYIGVGFKFVVD